MRNSFFDRRIRYVRNKLFPGSASYWESHYRSGGDSGTGSYGRSAEYKANFLNGFVKDHQINTVIEFGCGDGNQVLQFHFPSYIGLDISNAAIEKCIHACQGDPSKNFFIYSSKTEGLKAELAISLDVIYHLIEDEVYENYMRRLFGSATRYVIIYAWDVESDMDYHVKHRKFSEWIENNVSEFRMLSKVKSSNFSDFYLYERR